MNHRLIHDAAFQMAEGILRTVKDCLYEQEHRDAFQEFYEICKRALEEYETQANRMQQRLKPCRN
jgi:hypothetical protein